MRIHNLAIVFYVGCLLLGSLTIGCADGTSESDPSPDLEKRKEKIMEKNVNVSEEALNRKARSTAILTKESVPQLASLPVIETENESKRRTTEEVAERAMALCIVAARGEGMELKMVNQLIKDFRLENALTPAERDFVKQESATELERAQFVWRYECCWVLLWSLGYVDELKRPDSICDVKFLVTLIKDKGRDKFIKDAKLRPQAEILDAADLIYRYHWACVDARINNRNAPAGLDEEIVMERHHALNWLIGYMAQAWDDVTTDT